MKKSLFLTAILATLSFPTFAGYAVPQVMDGSTYEVRMQGQVLDGSTYEVQMEGQVLDGSTYEVTGVDNSPK
jgi:hypothetical protein